MSGLVHDDQLALRPGVVEPPDDAEEVAEVQAALHEGARDALQQVRVPQDHALVVAVAHALALAEEVAVAPVVGDGTGEAPAELRVPVPGDRTGRCGDDRRLPVGPGPGGPVPDRRVGRLQETVVGGGQVALALLRGQLGEEPLVRLREDLPQAPGQQGHLGVRAGRDPGQHQFGHHPGVRLRVPQAQCRAPGHAPHQPPLDAQVGTQPLQVGHEVGGRVDAHVGVVGARAGQGPSGAALVEQDDPIGGGVEVPPEIGAGPAPRSPVQDQGWLAVRISAGLPVDAVAVADVEHAVVVRFDHRIEAHRSTVARRPGPIIPFTGPAAPPSGPPYAAPPGASRG